MRKLVLMPSQAGYGAAPGEAFVATQLDGGPSRRRATFIGAVASASVSWSLPPLEYLYLDAFYRSVTENGLTSFLIDLVLDGWVPLEYEARFVLNSYRVAGVRGMETTVTAQLEVKPRARDREFDLAIVDLYEALGDGMGDFINGMDHLVNVHLPAAWPPQ